MLGWKLIRKAELAALEDESHLLRCSGYFVQARPDGLLEKGYNGRVEIVYEPGKGPWRRSASYRKVL